MKKILIILVLISLPVVLESQVLKEASYTASNGVTYKVGGYVNLGHGSNKHKNAKDYFVYVYSAPFSLPRTIQAGPSYVGHRFKIKKIKVTSKERKVIFVCGAGELVNYWIEIENAIKAGEVVAGRPKKRK